MKYASELKEFYQPYQHPIIITIKVFEKKKEYNYNFDC